MARVRVLLLRVATAVALTLGQMLLVTLWVAPRDRCCQTISTSSRGRGEAKAEPRENREQRGENSEAGERAREELRAARGTDTGCVRSIVQNAAQNPAVVCSNHCNND